KIFIAEGEDEERKFAKENWGNWKEILKKFQNKLSLESAVLNYLVKYKKDFGNAFGKLPKNIRRLFIHAYQSYIFNKVLEKMINNKEEIPEEIPLIGYETKLEGKVGGYIKEILKEEKIKLEMFKLKRTPTLAEPGSLRNSFAKVKNFRVLKVKDGFLKIRFILDKGCYATTVLSIFGECLEK
ncbi:MAG: tRNA pseudouridine(13) synthase TruD, partial [Candidatus Aenigmarchaeota archaeon]|nr:tRNA pseudouridine(13) synthase TruD [Candidatus Aenigmarchaeota archaeon]